MPIPLEEERRSIHLKDYGYSISGGYFIPICTHNKECLFRRIMNDEMVLNEYGEIIHSEYIKLSDREPYIELDVFQIMPNHIRGVIVITEGVGAVHEPPECWGNS
jgi:REP element-mobilizing transposase RayT